jgi:fido (protein-threonine AMPylation protein)
MWKWLKLRRAHARFLESNRSLKNGKEYWDQASGHRRWLLQAISTVPLLGLHEDGQSLFQALKWLEANCRSTVLGEEVVRRYHRMICQAGDSGAGAYRKNSVAIRGSPIPRAAPDRIPALMKQWALKLEHEQRRLDAIPTRDSSDVLSIAVDVQQRLGMIHPFSDGNGRVSRLAMNHLLRRYGLGYVIFPPLHQEPLLLGALEDAHRGKPEQLLSFARKHLCQL